MGAYSGLVGAYGGLSSINDTCLISSFATAKTKLLSFLDKKFPDFSNGSVISKSVVEIAILLSSIIALTTHSRLDFGSLIKNTLSFLLYSIVGSGVKSWASGVLR